MDLAKFWDKYGSGIIVILVLIACWMYLENYNERREETFEEIQKCLDLVEEGVLKEVEDCPNISKYS